MEEHKLKSWEEFRPLIQEIRQRFGAIQRELPNGTVYDRKNNILFRGQFDGDWELETTLERKTRERYDVLRYIIDANYRINELESFTGNRWNIETTPELRESIKNTQDLMRVYLPTAMLRVSRISQAPWLSFSVPRLDGISVYRRLFCILRLCQVKKRRCVRIRGNTCRVQVEEGRASYDNGTGALRNDARTTLCSESVVYNCNQMVIQRQQTLFLPPSK